ncbi:hypothetical protein VNI00_009839 [Paramarasmius palmivorus]|uniref:TERF2-interacting telomeric protein 1 Myb domain-containing protein n=1 Tax=Paramarasmius palmivorus TaxID=297713 RepID=A0AAW0CKW3_9AGAR
MATSGGPRNPYTDDEDAHLIEYLAKCCPDPRGRKGQTVFKQLEDDEAYPWHKRHTWQSWRDRYVKHSDYFDKKIRIYQRKNGIVPTVATQKVRTNQPTQPTPSKRNDYTEEDEEYLVEYLATKTTSNTGRKGNNIYKQLVDDEVYPWHKRHPWQSWRDRYVKNSEDFDRRIKRYQRKKGLGSTPQDESSKDSIEEVVIKKPQQTSPQKAPLSTEAQKKRKRISGISDDTRVEKRPKVLEPKGKDVVRKKPEKVGAFVQRRDNGDVLVSTFVTVSQIPRRRAQATAPSDRRIVEVEEDRGEGSSRGALAAERNSGSGLHSSRIVSSRPSSSLKATSSVPSASAKSKTTNRPAVGTEKPKLTSHSGDQTVRFVGEDDDAMSVDAHQRASPIDIDDDSRPQSPLFTQPAERRSLSPLFTQRPENDDSETSGSGHNSLFSQSGSMSASESRSRSPLFTQVVDVDNGGVQEEEDDSHEVDQMLTDPAEPQEKDEDSEEDEEVEEEASPKKPPARTISRLPEEVEPSQTQTQNIYPLLGSPLRSQPDVIGDQPLPGSYKSTGRPNTAQLPPSQSLRPALLSSQGRKPKQPPRLLEGPYRSQFAAAKKAREISEGEDADDNSDDDEDLVPVPPKKKPLPQRAARHTTAKPHPFDVSPTPSPSPSPPSRTKTSLATNQWLPTRSPTPPVSRLRAQPVASSSRHGVPPPSPPPQPETDEEYEEESEMTSTEIDENEQRIHPFDAPSQPTTPKPQHPFDMSQQQSSMRSVRSHVSEKDMEKVVHVLERFISKLDTERRERLMQRSGMVEGDEVEQDEQQRNVVSNGEEKELLQRGSPLPRQKDVDVNVLSEEANDNSVHMEDTDVEEQQPQPSTRRLSGDRANPQRLSDRMLHEAHLRVEDFQPHAESSIAPHHRTRLQTGPEHLFSTSSTPAAPQITNKGKAKATAFSDGPRRHTIGPVQTVEVDEEEEDSIPPRVDLRMALRSRRKSLPSRSSVSSTISRDLDDISLVPSVSHGKSGGLSERDQARLVHLQVARMAHETGLSEEKVLEVWNEYGDLEVAETVLRDVAKQLNDLFVKAKRRRSSVSVGGMGSSPMAVIGPKEKEEDSVQQRPRTISPTHTQTSTRRRRSSRFQPTFVDEDDIPDSEYSPPAASRAGKFVRLKRQGRVEEAFEREKRRASASGSKRARDSGT